MYIGNDLQVAESGNRIIDDISSSFNGSTTSFALLVGGVVPVPFPINTQQIYISVNNVVQEPDPTGSSGFKILGNNIVFSSAPTGGHAFFGVILSGADYVTVGTEFPSGSEASPSITFSLDNLTGFYSVSSGTVGFTASGTQIFTMDGNGFNFPDNKKLQLGSANDLQIYHDGSNSYIKDAGTGNLQVMGTNLVLENASGENYIECTSDGSVALFYDNSSKLQTVTGGINVTGTVVDDGATHDGDVTFTGAAANVVWDKSADDLIFNDNAKAAFGTSSDLQIYHDGSNSYVEDGGTGDLILKGTVIRPRTDSYILANAAGSETFFTAAADGAVALYYDNSSKLQTVSGGINVTGTVVDDGATHDGDVTFTGDAANVTWDKSADDLIFNDNAKSVFGTGGDLEIYHDGSNSYVKDAGTGNLHVMASNLILESASGENYIDCTLDGAVALYYDNSSKLQTVSGGVNVTGTVVDDGATHDGDVIFTGNAANVTWDKSADDLIFNDNAKAVFGTSSDGLEVYHDGSNSYITDTGTGSLILKSDTITVKDSAGNNLINTTATAAELYYDGSKKLETVTGGVNVTGDIQINAQNELRYADADSSNYISFKAPATVASNITYTLPAADAAGANYVLASNGSGTLSWIADPSGQWVTAGDDIYFSGGNVGIGLTNPATPLSVTGATTLNGDVTFTGDAANVTWDKSVDDLIFNDNAKAAFGTGSDLQIYHDGSNSYITDAGTGAIIVQSDTFTIEDSAGNDLIRTTATTAELYYEGSKKLDTVTGGIDVTGTVVDDGATHDGDVTFTGASNNVVWDKSDNALEFADNAKAVFGTGGDLEIFHNASHSVINDAGTGDILLQVGGSTKCTVNSSGITATLTGDVTGNVTGNASGSAATVTGAAQSAITSLGTLTGLTINGDVTFTGAANNVVWDKSDNALEFADSAIAVFGAGDDFQLQHTGSYSKITNTTGDLVVSNTGDLYLQSDNSVLIGDVGANEYSAKFIDNGAVELYHDNVIKLQTRASDVWIRDDLILADSDKIKLGDGNDLQIYHDGSNSHIHQDGTGDLQIRSDNSLEFNTNGTENAIWCDTNGAVKLYHNNNKKFETTSTGTDVTGVHVDDGATHDGDVTFTGASNNVVWDKSDNALEFADSAKAIFGAGGDLTIEHDSNHSYINHNGGGDLFVQTDGLFTVQKFGTTERLINANSDGNVELFHNADKKFETASDGIELSNAANSKVEQKFHYGTNSSYALITMDDGNNLVFNSDANTAGSNSYMAFKVDNSEKMRIDTSGRLLVGLTSARDDIWNGDGTNLELAGTDYSGSSITLSRWVNSSSCPHFIIGKSRGGAVGTHAAVQDDDYIGIIGFAADDGTDLLTGAAQITCEIDGTPGSNDIPGRLAFWTTADGSNSPVERMRITSKGNVGVGTTAPVASASNYDGAALHLHQTSSSSAGSQIHLTNGATGAAAANGTHISMWSDDDLYITNQESDGQIKFASGGNSDVLVIDDDGKVGIGVTAPDARLALPAGESSTPIFAIESAVDANDFTFSQYEDGNGVYTLIGQNIKLDSGGNESILDSGHKTASIYFDGRNSGALIFNTGDTNASSERLRITKDGMMEMRSEMSTAGSKNILRFTDTDTSAAAGQSMGRVQWYSSDASGAGACVKAEIEAVCQDTTPDGAIIFKTQDGGSTTAPEERLRIASDGKLQSLSGVQSGGNSTSGFAFQSVDSACVLGVQGKSAANGGAAGNALFQGWFGTSNTFRVNCDGTVDAACFTSTDGTGWEVKERSTEGDINVPHDGWTTIDADYSWNLPAAGTYRLSANVRVRIWDVNGYIKARFSGNYGNGHAQMLFESGEAEGDYNVSVNVEWIYPATGADDVMCQFRSSVDSTGTSIQNDANGRNFFFWERIG